MRQHIAYLAGVVRGDGWVTPLTIGLRVKDREFAEAFAVRLRELSARTVEAKQDERGYWLVRSSNKTGLFDHLKVFEPKTLEEKAAFLRGMFDSEGNACCSPNKASKNSYHRRVAFYSTDLPLLWRLERYLAALGMVAALRTVKNSEGHKGTKTVYELKLTSSKENFARFASKVGSSIPRKVEVLERIPNSYGNPADYCSRGGKAGCAARWGKEHAGD